MLNIFGIDEKCRVDKFIAKKHFYENFEMSETYKRQLSENVKKIILTYQLNPTKINIKPYKDKMREYSLINVINVVINEKANLKCIAEIIMCSIPYPMILVFTLEDKMQIWTAHQRVNEKNINKNVLEGFANSEWTDKKDQLFELLNIQSMNFSNFFALYTDFVDTISIYEASKTMGIKFDENHINGNKAREILIKAENTKKQLSSLKAKLKKETQFNKRVELRLEINKLDKL